MLALVLLLGGVAVAEPLPATGDPITVCGQDATTCQGINDDGTFTVDGASGTSPSGPQGGSAGAPVVLPDSYVVYEYAPTCTGNTRADAGVLCGSAVTSCRQQGAGWISYWRWEATVDRATGQVRTPPGWVQSPGSFCLGPGTAGLPPVAAIGGVLASDLQRLVVVKGVAHAQPDGTTLVNLDTGFWTEAARYVLDPVTILGHRVVLTATPASYDWHFGDGAVATDAGPGHEGTLEVAHTYRRTGAVSAYVVITWTATFTVDGGAPQDVVGTAVTTGPGTPLQVKQARAELVDGGSQSTER